MTNCIKLGGERQDRKGRGCGNIIFHIFVHDREREESQIERDKLQQFSMDKDIPKTKNYLINDQLRKMRRGKREGKGRGEGNIIFHICVLEMDRQREVS